MIFLLKNKNKKECINIIIRNLFQKSLLGINKNLSMIKA